MKYFIEKTEVKECPYCHGNGYRESNSTECPWCNGTGTIAETVFTEEER